MNIESIKVEEIPNSFMDKLTFTEQVCSLHEVVVENEVLRGWQNDPLRKEHIYRTFRGEYDRIISQHDTTCEAKRVV